MASRHGTLKSLFFLLLVSITNAGIAQYQFVGTLNLEGYFNDPLNPFWFYSNHLGEVSPETQGLGKLDAYYRRYLGETTELEIGGSLFLDYKNEGANQLQGGEYFASVSWMNFRFTAGARARPEQYLGLSSVIAPPFVKKCSTEVSRNSQKCEKWVEYRTIYWEKSDCYLVKYPNVAAISKSRSLNALWKVRLHHLPIFCTIPKWVGILSESLYNE